MSLLLLLLFVCSSEASHFMGTVMTYDLKETHANGSITVMLRYKLNFLTCSGEGAWLCVGGGACGVVTSLQVQEVQRESGGAWCQLEGVRTQRVPGNAPFTMSSTGSSWIDGIVNGVSSWSARTQVELRTRSDTGRANASPKTTVLPVLRVPSNCPRNFDLLAFDPDGDEVRCRNSIAALSECVTCTPPAVLNLSSSCSLAFGPTSSSNEGPYKVQLMMEDFLRRNITLTQTDGVAVTAGGFLSRIPVQFVVQVDPAAPSCTDGLYLPRFLPPTPANRARLDAPVNRQLTINISAEANVSTISELLFSGPAGVGVATSGPGWFVLTWTPSEISELLFSGPAGVSVATSGPGRFVLTWTPSENRDGESHAVCFAVQALHKSAKFQSDLRCVAVSVGRGAETTKLLTRVNPPEQRLNTTVVNETTTTPTPTTAVATLATPTPTPTTAVATLATPTPTPTTAVATLATPTPTTAVATLATPTPTTAVTNGTTPTPTTTVVTLATPTPTPSVVNGTTTPTPTPLVVDVTTTPTPTPPVANVTTTPTPTPPVANVTTTPTPTPLVVDGTATPTPTPLVVDGTTTPTPTPLVVDGTATPTPTPPVVSPVAPPPFEGVAIFIGRVRLQSLFPLTDEFIRTTIVEKTKELMMIYGLSSTANVTFVKRL